MTICVNFCVFIFYLLVAKAVKGERATRHPAMTHNGRHSWPFDAGRRDAEKHGMKKQKKEVPEGASFL